MKRNQWARLLAYVTGQVNQELLLQNEYLAAEIEFFAQTCQHGCACRIPSDAHWRRLVSGSGVKLWTWFHAAMLTVHGHRDWRVPTKNELNVLFNNRAAIGGFNVSGSTPGWYWYWSSSSLSKWNAWSQ